MNFRAGYPIRISDCLAPGKGGELISRKGTVVDRDKFEAMRDEYYGHMGWDITTGLQTTATLEQLELKDVAEVLAKEGLAV